LVLINIRAKDGQEKNNGFITYKAYSGYERPAVDDIKSDLSPSARRIYA
jgi:hypothetical protein